eukprot:CAMPEP_0171424694 /NCGR_PEP_ID=MMETSP0881-20121228/2856_1 /TAXON_ID=67004 /ORGANISM="Thalassiosira weissflogii, Strain CCMP1336" /LENGTH=62 /DNA_ID=CAMNT_0011943893 /DNA_START=36 /DNA_END=224 /DNA_ORIENTATION=+
MRNSAETYLWHQNKQIKGKPAKETSIAVDSLEDSQKICTTKLNMQLHGSTYPQALTSLTNEL